MRITLISILEENEISKVTSLMKKIDETTCKVPYGIDDEKRLEIDNLPYHFTIFATNKKNQNEILEKLKSLKFPKIRLKVKDIKIMNGSYGSYCLYLSIEENNDIKKLQRVFYNEFPKERYNPDDFIFHMTLHIDKDYNKVLKLQELLKESFEPFFLEFNQLALFDYPGELIETFRISER